MINVRIQEQDFDAAAEKQHLQKVSAQVGAVVEFTGVVRAHQSPAGELQAIFLEHYPGMTEKAIAAIIAQALSRWPLLAVTLIHRVGTLPVGANIVYVGVASSHRHEALQCVDFIMDYLKNEVPVWKKELYVGSADWVAQKQRDIEARQAWILGE